MVDTPSERIVKAANATVDLTDSLGRTITVRTLNALDQMRMLRAIGPAQSSNMPYVQMVECVLMATAIDGMPLPTPSNERQIDAGVQRLGDEGMVAVMVHRMQAITAMQDEAEAATGEGEPPAPLVPSAPLSSVQA